MHCCVAVAYRPCSCGYQISAFQSSLKHPSSHPPALLLAKDTHLMTYPLEAFADHIRPGWAGGLCPGLPPARLLPLQPLTFLADTALTRSSQGVGMVSHFCFPTMEQIARMDALMVTGWKTEWIMNKCSNILLGLMIGNRREMGETSRLVLRVYSVLGWFQMQSLRLPSTEGLGKAHPKKQKVSVSISQMCDLMHVKAFCRQKTLRLLYKIEWPLWSVASGNSYTIHNCLLHFWNSDCLKIQATCQK